MSDSVLYGVIIGVLATAIVPRGIKSIRWWIVMIALNGFALMLRHGL